MKIPGPKSYSPLGFLPQLKDNVLDFTTEQCLKHGNITAIRAAHKRIVFITGSKEIEHILRSNHKNYIKGISFQQLAKILGNGLLVADGAQWKFSRQLQQPYFNRSAVLNYKTTINDCIKDMLPRLQHYADTGESFNLLDEMDHLSFHLAAKSLLGTELNTDLLVIEDATRKVLDFIYSSIQSPINIPLWLPTSRNKAYKKNKKILDDLVYKLIAEKRKNTEPQDDLLSKFIEAKHPESSRQLTDEELRDEVMSALLGAHKTTAEGITWGLYYICTHPEVLQKAQQEIADNITEEIPNTSHFEQLSYLGQCLDESLRLVPPAWCFTREAIAADTISGYKISPKDVIIISPYTIHRIPELWPQPEHYDPERFDKALNGKRSIWHYLPFGVGPHTCIGKHFSLIEMRIVVAAILKHFTIELTKDANIEFEAGITLSPKNGIPVSIKNR